MSFDQQTILKALRVFAVSSVGLLLAGCQSAAILRDLPKYW